MKGSRSSRLWRVLETFGTPVYKPSRATMVPSTLWPSRGTARCWRRLRMIGRSGSGMRRRATISRPSKLIPLFNDFPFRMTNPAYVLIEESLTSHRESLALLHSLLLLQQYLLHALLLLQLQHCSSENGVSFAARKLCFCFLPIIEPQAWPFSRTPSFWGTHQAKCR